MKKINMIVSIIFVTFFAFTIKVNANTIDSIDMDIYIDKNGNAQVTETWQTYLTEGTEGYKPYYNLENSTITDFTVERNGKKFQFEYNWNIEGSLYDKAYKNGIVTKPEGVELCWGISEYGYNKYVLKYKINNFIYKTKDNQQMLYWTLIPRDLSTKPGQVSIKIHADEAFSKKLDVWGYGNYGGTAYVYDGRIEMNSDGKLDTYEHMTLLVKFPKNTFKVSTPNLDKTFKQYKKMADKGAVELKRNKFLAKLKSIAVSIGTFILMILVGGCVYITIKYPKMGNKHTSYGPSGKKLKNKYKYYRELPCDKDILKAYLVANCYGLVNKKTDFLGAVLLKWIKIKVIRVETTKTGKIFKKENTKIFFENKDLLQNDIEKQLYDMMVEASKDKILEAREFETWCQINYQKILSWFDNVIDKELDVIAKEGKCDIKIKKLFKIFHFHIYQFNENLKEEAEKLAGLKRFFEDFSDIANKYPIEVVMWEEYLMYAQIFGMANKVAKEFKKIYPDQITDLSISEVVLINDISYSGIKTAQSRADAYTSGGGGYSSGGGGGGSFGGGGGGGGFR